MKSGTVRSRHSLRLSISSGHVVVAETFQLEAAANRSEDIVATDKQEKPQKKARLLSAARPSLHIETISRKRQNHQQSNALEANHTQTINVMNISGIISYFHA